MGIELKQRVSNVSLGTVLPVIYQSYSLVHVGDTDHTDQSLRNYLQSADFVKDFAEAGVTEFCTEMFSPDQAEMLEKIQDHIRNGGSPDDKEITDFGFSTSSLSDCIAATRMGMNYHGVNPGNGFHHLAAAYQLRDGYSVISNLAENRNDLLPFTASLIFSPEIGAAEYNDERIGVLKDVLKLSTEEIDSILAEKADTIKQFEIDKKKDDDLDNEDLMERFLETDSFKKISKAVQSSSADETAGKYIVFYAHKICDTLIDQLRDKKYVGYITYDNIGKGLSVIRYENDQQYENFRAEFTAAFLGITKDESTAMWKNLLDNPEDQSAREALKEKLLVRLVTTNNYAINMMINEGIKKRMQDDQLADILSEKISGKNAVMVYGANHGMNKDDLNEMLERKGLESFKINVYTDMKSFNKMNAALRTEDMPELLLIGGQIYTTAETPLEIVEKLSQLPDVSLEEIDTTSKTPAAAPVSPAMTVTR